MARTDSKNGGGRKKGGGAAAGKNSNTKAKKGSQRSSGRAGSAALSLPFGIVAPSTAKPDAFPPEDMLEGPPVATVKALRPLLQRTIFDAGLWLRAFERSGGRFGRARRSSSSSSEREEDDGEEAKERTSSGADASHDADGASNEEPEDSGSADRAEPADDNHSGGEEEEDEDDEAKDETNEGDEGSNQERDEDDDNDEDGEGYGNVESRFNSAKLKQLRQIVQMGTIDAVLRGKYFLADRPVEEGQALVLREVHLNRRAMQKAATATRMYASDHAYALQPTAQKKKPGKGTPPRKTEILVVEGDCLEAALIMRNKRGLNPAVLNMASRSNPCGGYRHGTGAQEESITRRSNLFQCLEDPYHTDTGRQWSYPLPEFGGLYSPDVTVFRRSEAAGYAFMEEPQSLSIISVAAYSNPPVEEVDGELRLSGPAIVNNFKKKIRAIFNMALDNGHESIVLGAFGCGVFGNPPKHIAQLFGEVLRKDFADRFEMVVFAVIDGVNSFQCIAHPTLTRILNNNAYRFNPQGNVLPFSQAFKCDALTLDEFAERIAHQDDAGDDSKASDSRRSPATWVEPATTKIEQDSATESTTQRGKRRRRAPGKGSKAPHSTGAEDAAEVV